MPHKGTTVVAAGLITSLSLVYAMRKINKELDELRRRHESTIVYLLRVLRIVVSI